MRSERGRSQSCQHLRISASLYSWSILSLANLSILLLLLLSIHPISGNPLSIPLPLPNSEIDFSGNITARAPYPYLSIAVKQNGEFVDSALTVSPGTPLEMIISLDDKSASVYGLLVSFLKVTDASPKNQEEVIVLNGCSIDPYIFGNFESSRGGDAVSAKFRAFKFPDSDYVLFQGTVNVCLNECQGVPCGNGQFGHGRRRRRSSAGNEANDDGDDLLPDPNKIFEVEMTTLLQVTFNRANSSTPQIAESIGNSTSELPSGRVGARGGGGAVGNERAARGRKAEVQAVDRSQLSQLGVQRRSGEGKKTTISTLKAEEQRSFSSPLQPTHLMTMLLTGLSLIALSNRRVSLSL